MRSFVVLLAVPLACAHSGAQSLAAPQAVAQVRPAIAPEPTPQALLQQAHELMGQKSWQAAREKFDAFFARGEASADAWFEAGWVAEQVPDPQSASAYYRRALAVDPAHPGAALNLARLLREKPGEAEAVLRPAAEKDHEDPRLLDALCAALRAQGKLDEAEAAARKVLERHPRHAAAWRNVAAVEVQRGRLRLAEIALNNARKLDANDPAIANALGLLAIRRDDPAAARGWFEEATRLGPKFAPGWLNLGALALRYRDYAKAEQALARALELDEGRPEAHLARAWALEGLRRPAEARGEYEKVLALQPGHDDALFGRALALKAEGNLAAAAAAFRQCLALEGSAHRKDAQQQLAAIDLRLQAAAARRDAGPTPAELSKSSHQEPTPAQAGAVR